MHHTRRPSYRQETQFLEDTQMSGLDPVGGKGHSEPIRGGEQYFTREPHARSRPTTVHLALRDVELDLITDHGVFAYGQLDRGTDLLLRTIPKPPVDGNLLDLGCGYGAIALVLARWAPEATIWAVDVNQRALALCERNAKMLGARNVTVAAPEDVPAPIRFAGLYTNPPVRVGKEPLHDLLTTWFDRLLPDAHAYLVMQRNLGSDSLARWLAGRGHTVERLRSRTGYRVLDVHAMPDTTHD
jgi:16S rRNA (guanine1207-N2)-methyltransferase